MRALGGILTIPLLLDIEPAAEVVGISRSTMYKLLNDGSIKSVHIGRRRLIEWSELDRFVGELRQQDGQS